MRKLMGIVGRSCKFMKNSWENNIKKKSEWEKKKKKKVT
jgi:hypothetical protein